MQTQATESKLKKQTAQKELTIGITGRFARPSLNRSAPSSEVYLEYKQVMEQRTLSCLSVFSVSSVFYLYSVCIFCIFYNFCIHLYSICILYFLHSYLYISIISSLVTLSLVVQFVVRCLVFSRLHWDGPAHRDGPPTEDGVQNLQLQENFENEKTSTDGFGPIPAIRAPFLRQNLARKSQSRVAAEKPRESVLTSALTLFVLGSKDCS